MYHGTEDIGYDLTKFSNETRWNPNLGPVYDGVEIGQFLKPNFGTWGSPVGSGFERQLFSEDERKLLFNCEGDEASAPLECEGVLPTQTILAKELFGYGVMHYAPHGEISNHVVGYL